MRITADIPETYPLVDRWVIQPGIRLENDRLVYDAVPADPRVWSWAERPTARLLWDFAGLAEAAEKDILAYAKKWGVLALCRHGIPAETVFSSHFRSGRMDCHATGKEPIRKWREYASIFQQELVSIDETRADNFAADKTAWDISRKALTFGHLRPVLVRTEVGELALRLSGSRVGAGLPAALCYQLLVLMAGGKGLLVCAECGNWFESANRRNPDRNVYCDQCGRAAAVRAASRRYYENHKRRKREDNDGTQTQRR
jgi:hypothetical protein